MIREILCNLLNSASVFSTVRENSFKNFHAPGVNYLCLHKTPSLTIKLYIFRPNEVGLNADGLVVNPHNHHYNFSTTVLAGLVVNHVYQSQPGTGWYQFHYASPIKESRSVTTYVGERKLNALWSESVTAKASKTHYYMEHDMVHSITVNPKVYTALCVTQYSDMSKPYTTLFMREPQVPRYDGLYKRYSFGEIDSLLFEFKKEADIHV